jgi:hypothetical protein
MAPGRCEQEGRPILTIGTVHIGAATKVQPDRRVHTGEHGHLQKGIKGGHLNQPDH